MREVAHLAGVSVSTASYALNGRPEVNEDTRRRVELAARALDYHPSHAARGLRALRSNTVGLILPCQPSRFSAGVALEALGGIAEAVGTDGFDILVAQGSQGAAELAVCRRLMLSRKVDGLILTRSRVHDERFAELSARRFPFVVYGRAEGRDVYAAEIDNAAGARLAAEHLLGLGHKRIAFIGGPAELTATVDRLDGFRRALEQAGVGLDESFIEHGEPTTQGGEMALRSLFAGANPAPTAVFVASDAMAIGALHALRELCLEPGREVALVGFGVAAAAAFSDPPMTTVDHRPYEVGLVLGSMLLDRIHGRAIERCYQALEPRLVVSASSGGNVVRRWD